MFLLIKAPTLRCYYSKNHERERDIPRINTIFTRRMRIKRKQAKLGFFTEAVYIGNNVVYAVT